MREQGDRESFFRVVWRIYNRNRVEEKSKPWKQISEQGDYRLREETTLLSARVD